MAQPKTDTQSLAGSTRGQYLRQWTALEAQRSSWMADWLEAADFIDPWTFRYSLSETNRGGKRARRIINDTAGEANDTQAAGMMAGITNPSQQWFALKTADPDLNEYQPVREWLDLAAERLMRTFASSNVYHGFNDCYLNMGQYGIHCQLLAEDVEDVLRVYTFPMGEFCLAVSDRQIIDTVYRKYRMTVKQLVQWFTLDNVSEYVKSQYKDGNPHADVDVLHVIEPNSGYVQGKMGPTGKQWLSTYMEMGAAGGDYAGGYQSGTPSGKFLEQKGYQEFPCQAPRWRALNGNAYGVGPGLRALGDIKGLQELERSKGKAVQKIVDPPMVGPSSMMNERTSILPGAMNYTDQVSGTQVFRPAMEINPAAISTVEASTREHEKRIQRKFRADLWLSMLNAEGDPQKTAREIAEIHEEKMMQLGPTMHGLERELLGPVIHRSLAVHLRRGLLPPPPPELLRHGYEAEYLSVVARALKMIQNSGIDATSSFVGRFAGVRPEVLDVLNLDAVVRSYADNVGMRASLLNSEEQVQQIREQRQKATDAQQQADMAQKLAQGAQTLSQTDVSTDNALTRLLPGATLGGVQ